MIGGRKIWTIGHSTHTAEHFFSFLIENNISCLVDIRRFPGSKRYPHFNKDQLIESCEQLNIDYHHFENLGGRRAPLPESKNSLWKNAAFRGYADYMDSNEFKNAVTSLELLATEKNTAYMCSESVWWRCHRALLSDYFKTNGWKVLHIIGHKVSEHPYTEPARQKLLF